MTEIRDIVPADRTTLRTRYRDGRTVWRCHNPGNWHYYDSGRGLLPIAPQQLTVAESRVGNIRLRGAHPVTVGLRTDGAREKFIGFRRDFDQAGVRQLELSLEAVEINGRLLRDELWHNRTIDAFTNVMGPLVVYSHRRGTQIGLPLGRRDAFKLGFRVHTRGLVLTTDKQGRCVFRDECDRVHLVLAAPRILAPDGRCLFENADPPAGMDGLISHTLERIGPEEYLYWKESRGPLDLDGLPERFLADVDTVYSDTDDAYAKYSGADWADCQSSATADSVSSTNTQYYRAVCALTNAIYRSYFLFDLSALSGTVTATTAYFYANAQLVNTTMEIQEGTWMGGIGTNDFQAFTGSSFGSETTTGSGWKDIALDSAGVSFVSARMGGNMRVVLREGHDYSDTDPSGSVYRVALLYADSPDTSSDPYVEITTDAGGGIAVPVALHHLRQQGIA